MVPKHKTDNLGLLAEKAFKEAVKKAFVKHKQMGVPAVYMKNGKIVYLMPNGKTVEKIAKRKPK